MLIQVAEHHTANKQSPRLRYNLSSVRHQSPRLPHRRVVKQRQRTPYDRHAFVKSRQNLLATLRLPKTKSRKLCRIHANRANNPTRPRSQVIRKLPSGHRSRMRLPGQLLLWQPLRKSPRNRSLHLKLRQQTLRDGYSTECHRQIVSPVSNNSYANDPSACFRTRS